MQRRKKEKKKKKCPLHTLALFFLLPSTAT